jgi:RNA polymerase sigma factor (sigma-70 family)
MGGGALRQVLQAIRAAGPDAARDEDRQLLERFLRRRDGAAFEALVRRHGPMVLGVCRRLLRDPHDAEDAFQATFLVLLRKAPSLRRRELLANWLYGVALRTALKARGIRARRQARERPLTDLAEGSAAAEEAAGREWRSALDEEVRRLPAKYRVPVLLCYLQGVTFAEAARQLGWPAGTVSGRLARARELLRARLTRRGVTPPAALAGPALVRQASAVPVPLLRSTVHAAAAGTAPGPVAALTQGVLKAMFLSNLKIAAAVLLALGGAGVGVWATAAARQPDPPANGSAQATPPDKGDLPVRAVDVPDELKLKDLDDKKVEALLAAAPASDRMKALLKERLTAARDEAFNRHQLFLAGALDPESKRPVPLDVVLGSFLRLLEAERELSDKKSHQIAALDNHRHRVSQVEKLVEARFKAGRVSDGSVALARFSRLQAEIWLERAKGK